MNGFFVFFVTKPGCHLCDAAEPRVRQVARWLRCAVVERDVRDDEGLFERYEHRIPVVLTASGRVLAEGTVARRRLIWPLVKERLRARHSGPEAQL